MKYRKIQPIISLGLICLLAFWFFKPFEKIIPPNNLQVHIASEDRLLSSTDGESLQCIKPLISCRGFECRYKTSSIRKIEDHQTLQTFVDDHVNINSRNNDNSIPGNSFAIDIDFATHTVLVITRGTGIASQGLWVDSIVAKSDEIELSLIDHLYAGPVSIGYECNPWCLVVIPKTIMPIHIWYGFHIQLAPPLVQWLDWNKI